MKKLFEFISRIEFFSKYKKTTQFKIKAGHIINGFNRYKMNAEFEVIYSPALLANDFMVLLPNIAFTTFFIFFAGAIFFVMACKFKVILENGKYIHSITIGYFSILIILCCIAVSIVMSKISGDRVNYQNIRNYDNAKKIMGVLSPLEVKALSWPGNSLKLEHFDVLHFSINGHELKTNMRVDWNRSQKADMPLCYQDDLRELLTPYVGKQVSITYYNFVSNFHPTDDSRNLCIVDLAVKHN